MARSIELDVVDTDVGDQGVVAELQHRILTVVRITFVVLMVMLSVLHGAYLLIAAVDPVAYFRKLVWMTAGNMFLFTAGYIVVRAVIIAVIRHTLIQKKVRPKRPCSRG